MKKFLKTGIFIGIFITFCFLAEGKILEVKEPGTLQKVVDIAENGDTILVSSGYYEESVVVKKSIILKAKEKGKVIFGKYRELHGPFNKENGIYSINFPERVYGIYQDNGKYKFIHPKFREFTNIDKVKETKGSFFYDTREKKLYFSHEDQNLDLNKHSFGVSLLPYGIFIRDTENVIVEGFRFEYCGIIISNSKNITLRKNLIGRVNSKYGITINFSKDIKIENCAIFDSSGGFDISKFENIFISHCTVYRTRAHGIIANKGNDLFVNNSIFYSGGVSGAIFYIYPEVSNFKSDFNNLISYDFPARGFKVFFKGKRYDSIEEYRKISGNDLNSINVDPKFISKIYGKENISLQDKSPCKNKGSDGNDLGILNFEENFWIPVEKREIKAEKIEKKKPSILFLGGYVTSERPGRPNKYALRSIMPDEVLQENLKKWGYNWTIDFFSIHLTLDYLKQFNLVVMLDFPIPSKHPEISQKDIREIEKLLLEYVKEGGGLLLTGVTEYGMWAFEKDTDEMNYLLKPLDISIYKEQVIEKNPLLIRKSNISYVFDLAYTDNIIPHPITEGVKGLLYPISYSRMAYYTRPIKIGKNWTPLIKGSSTSCSVIYDLGTTDVSKVNKPKPGSVEKEPVILAVGEYGKGRIVLWPTAPTATIIDPYHKFWGSGIIMNPKYQKFPSYGEKLLYNIFNYLSSPSIGKFGGYTEIGPIIEEEREVGLYKIDWDKINFSPDYKEYPHVYKGIIGLKSSFSDGKSNPEEMIIAAKEAGYNFAVFGESLEKLTPEKLEQLNRICEENSNDEFQTFPGFTYFDASGNKWLVFRKNLSWPKNNWWYDKKRKIIRSNNDIFRGYGLAPVILIHPDKNPEPAMFQGNFKGIAVYTYQNNNLIDEAIETYIYLQSNGFRLFPVSVNFVDSAEEIKKSVKLSLVQSYVGWFNLKDIISSFAHLPRYQERIIYQRPHFISSGPLINSFLVVNFGTSDLAIPENDRLRMFINIASKKGIKEIKVFDKGNLYRRFLLSGEKEWSITMDGFHDKNHSFILFVKDIDNKIALSSDRSTHVQELLLVRCSDNLNTYTSGKFKAVPVFAVRGIENYIDRQAEAFSYITQIPGIIETKRPAVEQLLTFVSRFGYIKTDILNYYYPETAYPNWNRTDIPELAKLQDKFDRKIKVTFFTPWADGTVVYLIEGEINVLQDIKLTKEEIPIFTGNWVKEANTYIVSYKDGNYFVETIKPWSIKSLSDSLNNAFYVANIGAEGGSRAIIPLTENLYYKGLPSESLTHYLGIYLNLGKKELKKGEKIIYKYLVLYTPPQSPANNSFVEEVINKMGFKGKTEYDLTSKAGKIKSTEFILKIKAENYGFYGKITQCKLPLQLPVLIEGLNERWPAGIWYKSKNQLFLPVWKMDKVFNRYSTRQEFVLENPIFRFGVFDGMGMLQVDTETDDKEIYIGNLIICDNPEVFLEIEEIKQGKLKIFINNPTDKSIKVKIKPGPGFTLIGDFTKEVIIPEGGFTRIEIPD